MKLRAFNFTVEFLWISFILNPTFWNEKPAVEMRVERNKSRKGHWAEFLRFFGHPLVAFMQ